MLLAVSIKFNLSKFSDSKRVKAIRLLASGMSQAEVARQIGISRQLLSLWYKKSDFQQEILDAKKEILKKSVQVKTPVEVVETHHSQKTKNDLKEQLRERELDLLAEIEQAMLPLLREGSVRAAAVLLKLSERRSKLLALDQKVYQLLESVEFLVNENVIHPSRLEILAEGMSQLEASLKAAP